MLSILEVSFWLVVLVFSGFGCGDFASRVLYFVGFSFAYPIDPCFSLSYYFFFV